MKKGFTLSEVLITLGIIGVVASITIPTVINKYNEKLTVSKAKKIYSLMSQAYLLSVRDNGLANEWAVGNGLSSNTAIQIASYFKPYLKILNDCGTNAGCLGYKERYLKLLNGNRHDIINYDENTNFYKMILMDGSYIMIRAVPTYCQYTDMGVIQTCGAVFFDINGSKAPNTIGKDIFVAFITSQGLKAGVSDDCNLNGRGFTCLNNILKDGNMNYLH